MTAPEKLDPANDPRLTAYALGECDEAQRVEVEKILASDAAARAAVEEVRAAGAALSAGLARETGPGLTPEQMAAVLRAAPGRVSDPALPSARRRWRLPVAIAAVLVLGLGVTGLLARVTGGGGYGNHVSGSGTEQAARQTDGDSSGVSYERMKGGTMTMQQGGRNEKAGKEAASEETRSRLRVDGRESEAAPHGGSSPRLFQGPGSSAPPGLREPSDPQPPPPPAVPTPALTGGPPPGPTTPPDAPPPAAKPVGFVFGAGASPQPNAPAADPAAFEGKWRSGTSRDPTSGEAYNALVEQPLTRVSQEPLSTFSLDVDTASYANVRRMLNEGHLPPVGAARIEEMLNYFPYSYAAPKDGAPFLVHLEVAACPWNLEHRLVRIGVKGREIERAGRPASNLVFLIDVSGSMNQPNKLPLVKASLRMLLDELNERDHVSIAVYAGQSGLVLPPTSCEQKSAIQNAIDNLTPGGSTNGAAGIQLAYDTATQAFIAGGVNRVVLCTDGDWNVGVTSHDQLVSLIEEKAKTGVFLTVLGFGMGNYKDAMLVQLAGKGNGNYGYIDTTREAHKVLVEQASGTLVTIAKDVKVQVEFNPARVAAYRLIGYEKRILAKQDFNDDTKDAGEVGAGHTVTALYEITPVGAAVDAPGRPTVDPLKYQPSDGSAMGSDAPPAAASLSPEMLTVKVRYKEPDGAASKLLEFPLTDGGAKYENASADYKFQAAVAAFGMLLRRSQYLGTTSYDAVQELAGEGVGQDVGGYRKEFVDLVAKAKQLRR